MNSDITCAPCEAGVRPLNAAEAEAKLAAIPGWELAADASFIMRKYNFKNFRQSIEFVNEIGHLSEGERHHPDIAFGWGYVHITLRTHSVGGLSENDFTLASKINGIQ